MKQGRIFSGTKYPQVPSSRQILGKSNERKGQIQDFLIKKSIFCVSLNFLAHLFSISFSARFSLYAPSPLSGVRSQAAQPVPLALLKLSMAVYSQKLDG